MPLPTRDASGVMWLDTPFVYRVGSGMRLVKDPRWLLAHAPEADALYLYPPASPGTDLSYSGGRVKFRPRHDAVLLAVSDRAPWIFVAPFASRVDLRAFVGQPGFAGVALTDYLT